MVSWEIYIRTIQNHCEFWSVKLDEKGRATRIVCYGALGDMGRLFAYGNEAQVDSKRREKLGKGYRFFGKRTYPSPKQNEIQDIPCVIAKKSY